MSRPESHRHSANRLAVGIEDKQHKSVAQKRVNTSATPLASFRIVILRAGHILRSSPFDPRLGGGRHRPGIRVFARRGGHMIGVRSAVQALVVLALTAAIFPASVAAQGSTGRINGFVVDEQGGALPGVLVTLRNQQTGVARTLTSEADGRYDFPALSPGKYMVRVELQGFGVEEVRDIEVTI